MIGTSLNPAISDPFLLREALGVPAEQAAKIAAAPKGSEHIAKIAQDFESMFIGQMLQNMFSGMESDSLAGDPETDDVYRSWLVDEYGKMITKAGGIGVADHVQRELLHLQEMKTNPVNQASAI